VSAGSLTDDTNYHWQARTLDETGRTGAWVAFGGNAETATDFRITAGSRVTTTTINDDVPDPSVVGQPVTVTFTVRSSAGTPTGQVTVTDGTNACVGALAGGTGSCATALTTVGTRTLTAAYAGNSDFAPSTSPGSTHTVNRATTTTTITADTPDPSVVGQPVTISFAVAVVAPGAGTPAGTVTVSDGTQSCIGTLTAGAGSCTMIEGFTSVGTKNLTATYAGDTRFQGSTSAIEPHTVNKAATTTVITNHAPDPSNIGQQVTVNYAVTVNAPGAGSPTGIVTVTDGVHSCQGTRADGNCKITFTTGGQKTLVATYAGDANFQASASAGTPHTVTFFTATATITSDLPDPSAVGQPVPITFTVTSGSGTPTGTVTVTEQTNEVETCFGTLTAGVGTCSITFATPGDRSLVAIYAGDPQFAPDTSTAVNHRVNPFGAADTLRAISSLTVGGTAGGKATPAPTVIVVDAWGNPVEGATVTFTPGVGSGSASPESVPTGADGQAATTWTLGPTPGAQTLLVESGALLPVTFNATAEEEEEDDGTASGATSTMDAAPGSILVISGTATITVRLFDANDNPLTTGGDTVTLATSAGTLSGVTDNGDGTYTATLTAGVLPETATITGTVNGTPIGDTATVTFTIIAG
jgi:hypothetical protein